MKLCVSIFEILQEPKLAESLAYLTDGVAKANSLPKRELE